MIGMPVSSKPAHHMGGFKLDKMIAKDASDRSVVYLHYHRAGGTAIICMLRRTLASCEDADGCSSEDTTKVERPVVDYAAAWRPSR